MKIGVIGGNGVAATNRLCDLVERKVTASGAFRDAHHPEMIVWQATQAPSRSMYLEGRGSNWIPDYIKIAKALKGLGCDLGCMCCNTAHYAVDEIALESGLRFVNLLNEVATRAKESGETRFELFCSDGARKFDIYGQAFRRIFPECELVYPTEKRQRAVTELICAVKTSDRFRGAFVKDLLLSLVADATSPVILGCTDLRVAWPSCEERLPSNIAVDSLECLADALACGFLKEKSEKSEGN